MRSSPPVREDSSTSSMSNTTVSSISTTAASAEERRARLVGPRLPFDFLLVCARSLKSLSECDSSSADDGDRARFPFDFEEVLFLDSRDRGPLLSGSATTLCVGRRTRSDLRDIATTMRRDWKVAQAEERLESWLCSLKIYTVCIMYNMMYLGLILTVLIGYGRSSLSLQPVAGWTGCDGPQPHTRPYATGRVRFRSGRAKMVLKKIRSGSVAFFERQKNRTGPDF